MSALRTELAARTAYEGSSLSTVPWGELPESRRHAWRCTAAHLLAPKAERHAAVHMVNVRASQERLRQMASAA